MTGNRGFRIRATFKVRSAYKPCLGDDDEGIWAPYPVLVLVPPEDKP